MGYLPMSGNEHFHRGYSLRPHKSKSLINHGIIRGANFLQRSYSSGFHMSGVQGIACLVNQAQSCSVRLWGVGTASATKPLWSGAWSKMMRECDGIGGSHGSATHVEKFSPCLGPGSPPVRFVASKPNSAPGT